MEHSNPVQHKIILNILKNDCPDVWKEKVKGIILDAARAKFSQNDDLAEFLVGTQPLRIGEASRDVLWGVGIALENREVLDSTRWPQDGNLLGRTLEQVREELIAGSLKRKQREQPSEAQ